jgi:hypothetical protein
MIVANHEGSQRAIDWLSEADIKATDLDPEGKYFLLTRYLELSKWATAIEYLDVVTDDDLREAPVLNHVVAITYLLGAVPNELRGLVLNQLPFEAASFPLASDAAALEARRVARRYFAQAAQAATGLSCPVAATTDDEYALWLELRDPDESVGGRQRLEAKFRDPRTPLRLVHIGLQFGIKLDLVAVEREIDRQVALSGGMTQDAAIARFALAFTQKKPEDVASYIGRHRDELVGYIDRKSMQFLEIDMLSRAGLPDRAKECLGRLVEDGISEVEESRLRRTIAEAEGSDPVKARKEQFGSTDSLGDLMSLVEELENRGEWDDLCDYSEMLFERTQSLRDAERLAKTLANARKNEGLVRFLKDKRTLLVQSKNLQLIYCWALFDQGALVEGRTELEKLDDDWDNPNYRALQVNLGIYLGDWNSLSAITAKECREKDKRGAQELIGAAQLALHIGSPNAKELLFEAARKGSDDAEILTAAYLIASNAGWEDDEEVFRWLQKAATLSGKDGPIKMMSLKDVMELKPDWDRRESEIWKMLSRGEIPMFVAAQPLNKSLIDLMLFPALANLSENDPRRRGAVPAYSGQRQSRPFTAGGSVGIDATALLTLSFLNLLDKALDAFDAVHVPHSTLAWLFREKQKVAFHQPSRIRNAHRLQNLLTIGALEKLSQNTAPDSDLTAQVGEELALLIAEAEKAIGNDERQHVVVRSSPVQRMASLMGEEADLTAHAAVLSSRQAIVHKLREKGQITAEEEKRASAYLQLQEKPWPSQPEITDGAVLYLDDLTVTYFLHVGVLQKLQSAGFRPVVSPWKVSEANELISYEGISSKMSDAIERIRAALNSRIESGKVKVGRPIDIGELPERSISKHPSLGLFTLSRDCDALMADDRFLNQHANVDDGGRLTPVFSTLDLIDGLDSISPEDRLEHRTLLRRAGYFFMPVGGDELSYCLNASKIKDDKVIEVAELKAIRENVLRVRMTTWLQIPKETFWLDSLVKTFIQAMKGLWKAQDDIPDIRARSDWVISQIDVRGWAHVLVAENRDFMIKVGRGAYVLLLLLPPTEAPPKVREEYWSWIEDRILVPIKEQYPDLYSWIIEWHRRQVAYVADMDLSAREGIPYDPHVRSALAKAVLRSTPPLLRRALLEEAEFRKKYDLSPDAVLSFGDSVLSVRRSHLFNAIRAVYSGKPEARVTDTKGQKWKLKDLSDDGSLPKLVLSRSKQRFALPDFCALSSDRTTRVRSLNQAALDTNLPTAALNRWRNILEERALEDDEVEALHNEFRETPVFNARSIVQEITHGRSLSSLIPLSTRYFERLVGAYDGSAGIRDYAVGSGKALFGELSRWRTFEGFLFSLFASSHSSMTAEISVDQLNDRDLMQALDILEKQGDRISQVGAIEIGVRVLPSKPQIEGNIARLIELIRDDDTDEPSSQLKLLSALFVLVDGELSRTKLLATKPPFYRRLASLAQAALIQTQLANSGIDIDQFCEWAVSLRGWRFLMQSLTDMRLEPRWDPEYVAPSQLKQELFGRIMIAARNYEQHIKGSKLFNLVLGSGPQSLQSLADFHRPYLPGPLEGAEESQNVLSPEMRDIIKKQLSADQVELSSFIGLINSALIFHLDVDQAELAAKVLKLANYRLSKVTDRSQLLYILNGLATVAAVTRSHALADELRILVGRYRRDTQYKLSVEEAVRVCLVSAASRTDLKGWGEFAGDCLTELAFGDLNGDEGEMLHSQLRMLCHAAPELWGFCGRADAALAAYGGGPHSN